MSLFSNWFSPRLPDADLSVLKTDIHSHLIPGIDDGCKTEEDAIMIIRQLTDLGYKHLVITPHITGEVYQNNPDNIYTGYVTLNKAVIDARIPIKLSYAAEYLIDDVFIEKMEKEKLLTFGHHYLLVELSYFNPPQNIFEIIFDLQVAGYRVILAHPERYTFWHNNISVYEKLKERNVYFQLNIVSLTGFYSPESRKMAEKLIDIKMIDFLGTDMHNQNYMNAIKKALRSAYLEKALTTNALKNSQLEQLSEKETASTYTNR